MIDFPVKWVLTSMSSQFRNRKRSKQIVTTQCDKHDNATMDVIVRCPGRREGKLSSVEIWRLNEGLPKAREGSLIYFTVLIKLTAEKGARHLAHLTYLFSCPPFKFRGCAKPNMILTWLLCIDPRWTHMNSFIHSADIYWAPISWATQAQMWIFGTCLQSRHLWHFSKKWVPGICRKNKAVYMEGVIN